MTAFELFFSCGGRLSVADFEALSNDDKAEAMAAFERHQRESAKLVVEEIEKRLWAEEASQGMEKLLSEAADKTVKRLQGVGRK